MITSSTNWTESESIESIRGKFLDLTGVSSVAINEEEVGLEHFLRFGVGKDAALYRGVLAAIDKDLPRDHPYHGRLSLEVTAKWNGLQSGEVELLRSLINRSLRVTSPNTERLLSIKFVPFKGGEDRLAVQPANHAIQGRRGVGKSSLILVAHRKVMDLGHLPVWVDLQPFRSRTDLQVCVEVLHEILQDLSSKTATLSPGPGGDLGEGLQKTQKLRDKGDSIKETDLRKVIPDLQRFVKRLTSSPGRNVYVFLDDAHLLGREVQPLVFELVFSVFKGAGGWLKIAGVRNLLHLYESSTKTGLQHPNDIQFISLDLTLTNPDAARKHLTDILDSFLSLCGIDKRGWVIRKTAIDRLVWCSAGVPRDFLLLLERSIGFGLEARREVVGVQEVNIAVGEFGQQKMRELDEDTSQGGQELRESMDRLAVAALDQYRSNAFLVMQDSKHPGYANLQKLVDLRLVHLIHPSITPSKSGERYEVYLLDYSFYTGMRRRHGLKELSITNVKSRKYTELRRLPKISLNAISGGEQ